MTPKEKAKNLIDRFFRTGHNIDYEKEYSYAKANSLFCVEEIISEGGTKNVIEYDVNCFTNGIDYWENVKKEIKKL